MRWQAGWALRKELGPVTAAAVMRSADEKYVAPPHIARTSAGRFNLAMGAYLLALRDGLVGIGYESTAASDLLATSLYKVMGRFYRPMDALAVGVHPRNTLARARWRQRVSRRLFFRPPDWLMTEVRENDGYGFDVRRCALAAFMASRGERKFCQDVLCKQDLLMARARGERLERTQTIAAGDDRCDFRFLASRDRVGAI